MRAADTFLTPTNNTVGAGVFVWLYRCRKGGDRSRQVCGVACRRRRITMTYFWLTHPTNGTSKGDKGRGNTHGRGGGGGGGRGGSDKNGWGGDGLSFRSSCHSILCLLHTRKRYRTTESYTGKLNSSSLSSLSLFLLYTQRGIYPQPDQLATRVFSVHLSPSLFSLLRHSQADARYEIRKIIWVKNTQGLSDDCKRPACLSPPLSSLFFPPHKQKLTKT